MELGISYVCTVTASTLVSTNFGLTRFIGVYGEKTSRAPRHGRRYTRKWQANRLSPALIFTLSREGNLGTGGEKLLNSKTRR